MILKDEKIYMRIKESNKRSSDDRWTKIERFANLFEHQKHENFE